MKCYRGWNFRVGEFWAEVLTRFLRSVGLGGSLKKSLRTYLLDARMAASSESHSTTSLFQRWSAQFRSEFLVHILRDVCITGIPFAHIS